MVYDKVIQSAEKMVSSIKAITANFIASMAQKAVAKPEGWMKPPADFVKLNVDAAFDQELLTGAAGERSSGGGGG